MTNHLAESQEAGFDSSMNFASLDAAPCSESCKQEASRARDRSRTPPSRTARAAVLVPAIVPAKIIKSEPNATPAAASGKHEEGYGAEDALEMQEADLASAVKQPLPVCHWTLQCRKCKRYDVMEDSLSLFNSGQETSMDL